MSYTMQVEENHTGEFLLSEANGYRSRKTGTVEHDGRLSSGEVLRRDGSVYKPLAVSSGTPDTLTGDAIAVLYDNVDAEATGTEATIIARDAEVDGARLSYADAIHNSSDTDDLIEAAKTTLASVGIIVR